MLENIRDILVGANILHHAEENGEIMPSIPPETLTNRRIIETVLGSAPPTTNGGRITTKAVEAALLAFPARPDEADSIEQEKNEDPDELETTPENEELADQVSGVRNSN